MFDFVSESKNAIHSRDHDGRGFEEVRSRKERKPKVSSEDLTDAERERRFVARAKDVEQDDDYDRHDDLQAHGHRKSRRKARVLEEEFISIRDTPEMVVFNAMVASGGNPKNIRFGNENGWVWTSFPFESLLAAWGAVSKIGCSTENIEFFNGGHATKVVKDQLRGRLQEGKNLRFGHPYLLLSPNDISALAISVSQDRIPSLTTFKLALLTKIMFNGIDWHTNCYFYALWHDLEMIVQGTLLNALFSCSTFDDERVVNWVLAYHRGAKKLAHKWNYQDLEKLNALISEGRGLRWAALNDWREKVVDHVEELLFDGDVFNVDIHDLPNELVVMPSLSSVAVRAERVVRFFELAGETCDRETARAYANEPLTLLRHKSLRGKCEVVKKGRWVKRHDGRHFGSVIDMEEEGLMYILTGKKANPAGEYVMSEMFARDHLEELDSAGTYEVQRVEKDAAGLKCIVWGKVDRTEDAEAIARMVRIAFNPEASTYPNLNIVGGKVLASPQGAFWNVSDQCFSDAMASMKCRDGVHVRWWRMIRAVDFDIELYGEILCIFRVAGKNIAFW